MSIEKANAIAAARASVENASGEEEKQQAKAELVRLRAGDIGGTLHLAQQLEEYTGLESRLTILGHLQRGGTPSAPDRLLATRLGTACARYIEEGVFGVMVAARGEGAEPVPLAEVAGKRKVVPLDHPWVKSARAVGTCMGD